MDMSSVSLSLSLSLSLIVLFLLFVKLSLFFFSLANSKLLLITFLYSNRFFFPGYRSKVRL